MICVIVIHHLSLNEVSIMPPDNISAILLYNIALYMNICITYVLTITIIVKLYTHIYIYIYIYI